MTDVTRKELDSFKADILKAVSDAVNQNSEEVDDKPSRSFADYAMKSVVGFVVLLLVGILGWFGNDVYSKLSQHEKDISAIVATRFTAADASDRELASEQRRTDDMQQLIQVVTDGNRQLHLQLREELHKTIELRIQPLERSIDELKAAVKELKM